MRVFSVTQVPKAITDVYSSLRLQACCCIATAHLHGALISNMQDVIHKFRDRFCNFINGRSWGAPPSRIVPLSLVSPQQEGRPENFKQCLSSFGQTNMCTDAFDVCVTVHHGYNNINSQLDATIIISLIITTSLTCFGR